MPRAPDGRPKKLLLDDRQDRSQPAIVRATAYAELAATCRPLVSEVQQGLHDDDEIVRLGALRGLAGSPPSSAGVSRATADRPGARRAHGGSLLSRAVPTRA